MNNENTKWLGEATKKYESCAYACKRGLAGGCALDGYPVLDCPGCRSYKEKNTREEQK